MSRVATDSFRPARKNLAGEGSRQEAATLLRADEMQERALKR